MVAPAEARPLPLSRLPITTSSSRPSPLHVHAALRPSRPTAALALASLSSPRPISRRTNHLRRKLLKTLFSPPPSHPLRDTPQSPLEVEGEDEEGEAAVEADPAPVEEGDLSDGFPNAALVLEERESTLLLHQQVGEPHDVHPHPVDVPRLLLELSVYLFGLLAVQTACAILLFGGASVGEKKRDWAAVSAAGTGEGTVGEGDGDGPEVGGREVEFERVVSAIQAMAREARVAEAREVAEAGGVSGVMGDVKEEVKRRLVRLRKGKPSVRAGVRLSALVKGDVSKANRAPPKGFNGSKEHAVSARDLSNGAAPTIACDGHFGESPQPHVWKKSSPHGYSAPEKGSASLRDQVIADLQSTQTFHNLNASDRGMVRKPEAGMLNDHTSQGLVEDNSPIGGGIHYKQSITSRNASVSASKTKDTTTSCSQSLSCKKNGSSSMHRNKYNSEIASGKKTQSKHLHKKAAVSEADAVNQLWWLKLPYVLRV